MLHSDRVSGANLRSLWLSPWDVAIRPVREHPFLLCCLPGLRTFLVRVIVRVIVCSAVYKKKLLQACWKPFTNISPLGRNSVDVQQHVLLLSLLELAPVRDSA